MKVEFKSQNPDVMVEEAIYLGGEEIGWVRTKTIEDSHRCHAAIKTKHCDLIQGFGVTKEAAILAAIVDGRRETQRKLSAIDDIERRLVA